MSGSWRATQDRLFVIREEVETVSKGGILLTRGSQETPQHGVVISVGPDVTGFAVGDKVLFGQYSGAKVNLDGTEVQILRVEEILGRYSEVA
jgi:chaperonin GroES